MANYLIEGGKKLHGSVTTNASKNGSLALIAAALLNRGTTTLHNVAKIEEVNRLIEVLQSIGVRFVWGANRTLVITPPKKIKIADINYASAIRTRVVLFLLSILSHTQANFKIPQPGGCRLGKRTVLPHLFALEEFGISIKTTSKYYEIAAHKLHAAKHLVLYESGDTVTINAIFAAALIPKTSVISMASANYQVQEVCYYLQQLGVTITGIGTRRLEVTGVELIDQDCEYTVSEDPIESMLFLSIAATTGSQITIERCPIDFLELELLILKKMGLRFTLSKVYTAENGYFHLADITTYPSRLIAPPEKITAWPFPGLNIDNLPFFAPIATQAKGQTFIFDWVYEERVIYFNELKKLGADVTILDPHRVFVNGITKLKGNEIMCPPALRPSTIIMVAMLAAEGDSILRNVYSIERGYEDLPNRLRQLGAHIKKVD